MTTRDPERAEGAVSSRIIPVSRSLYVCEFHVGYQDGRVDLYGVLNALRPVAYPYTRHQLVLFVQLAGGIGDVPFFFDIRKEGADDPIHTTLVRTMRFPDRTTVLQLAMTVDGVQFPEPGLYVVDLFCHDTWVCDTTITLR